jgi:chemotaxis protein MotA
MPTTLFGIVIGVGVMVYAIYKVTTQDPTAVESIYYIYLNLPAFLIVAGGTVAAALIAHPLSHVFSGVRSFFKNFFSAEFNFAARVNEICDFSQAYVKDGVSGLEEKLALYRQRNLVKDGLQMFVNGYKIEEISEFLETSLSRKYDMDMVDFYIFRTMARSAPAFGMVGTLVGLIFMLSIMGDDPSKIGPFLAVALVTTFYGVLLANLFFLPMGNKNQYRAEINYRIGKMEMEGVMYVLKKQHPLYIKDELAGYLPLKQKRKLLGEDKKDRKKTDKKKK